MNGETVTHEGEIFQITDAVIRPRPAEPIPILVGLMLRFAESDNLAMVG